MCTQVRPRYRSGTPFTMNRDPGSRRQISEVNRYDDINAAARALAEAQFTLERLVSFMSVPQQRFGQGQAPALPQWEAYREAVRFRLISPGQPFSQADRILLMEMPEFQEWVTYDDRFSPFFHDHLQRIRQEFRNAVLLNLVLEVVLLVTPLIGSATRAIAMSAGMRRILSTVSISFGRLGAILRGARTALPPLRFPIVIPPGTTAAQLRSTLLRIWHEFPPIQSLHRVARSGATRPKVEDVLHEFFRETGVGWQPVGRGEVGRLTGVPRNRATIREGLLLIDEDVLGNPALFLEEVKHEISSNYVFGVRGSRMFPEIRGAGLRPPQYLEMIIDEGVEPVLRLITVE